MKKNSIYLIFHNQSILKQHYLPIRKNEHTIYLLLVGLTINPSNRNEFFILWTIINRSEERTTGWKQQLQICWTRVAPSRLSRRHNSKLAAHGHRHRIHNFRNLYNRLITNSSMSAHNQMGRQRLSITPATEKSIRNNEAAVPVLATCTFRARSICFSLFYEIIKRGRGRWNGRESHCNRVCDGVSSNVKIAYTRSINVAVITVPNFCVSEHSDKTRRR